jgi:hypothetical protein
MTLDEAIEYLMRRVNELEEEVRLLKSPQLMYRRPGGKEHEKVTDFLDDIENRLKKVEEWQN